MPSAWYGKPLYTLGLAVAEPPLSARICTYNALRRSVGFRGSHEALVAEPMHQHQHQHQVHMVSCTCQAEPNPSTHTIPAAALTHAQLTALNTRSIGHRLSPVKGSIACSYPSSSVSVNNSANVTRANPLWKATASNTSAHSLAPRNQLG